MWTRIVDVLRAGLVGGLVFSPTAGAAEEPDTFALQDLLSMEVSAASKFPQPVSAAPAAVTIITARDIREFGYRSLQDILPSIRGLHLSYDRNYHYLGARGFGLPGDYNSRILLLIDGIRVNDPIYESASIGGEFPLDVDLIDRIEFVPGPGSAVYGASAFFGVMNIVTVDGADIDGWQLAAGLGERDEKSGRLSAGRAKASGRSWLVSASANDIGGRERLYYPEFDDPSTNNGIAEDLDGERRSQIFAKYTVNNLTISAFASERRKEVPTAAFEQLFNTRPSFTDDNYARVGLQHEFDISKDLTLQSTLGYSYYWYDGDYIYDYPPVTINRDEAEGRWWNAELRLLATPWANHKIVTGVEYQNSPTRHQSNFDVDPFESYLDDDRSSERFGLYVQDEYRWSDRTLINAGIRFDDDDEFGRVTSPRIGVIHDWTDTIVVKLITGSAYRAPNAYELYYGQALGYLPNPDLEPETIETYEAILEYSPGANDRWTFGIFRYEIEKLIQLDSDPVTDDLFFDNLSGVRSIGAELQYEQISEQGHRLRASATWQDVEDSQTERQLVNSPYNLAKLNYSMPAFANRARLAVEVQYEGARRTLSGARVDDHWITNATLSSGAWVPGLELSLSIDNLFDGQYSHPGSEEHTQDSIPQDGRAVRAKLVYKFH